ncbi:hypothetical protein HPB50_012158 [Hyalomma asiaticum]|uniref:Uncharacterized protein n=1 Tax=Hyalomma asiaticum TaxID=266040 RepID=A0ACB7SV33_HYAAI|nr:hypothetical protein HPB50_012158 [Hyalomma asiaticum]
MDMSKLRKPDLVMLCEEMGTEVATLRRKPPLIQALEDTGADEEELSEGAQNKMGETFQEFAFNMKANLIEWLKGEGVYEDRDKMRKCGYGFRIDHGRETLNVRLSYLMSTQSVACQKKPVFAHSTNNR